jgi:hypothetical protein
MPHAARQPRSWLIFDVGQNVRKSLWRVLSAMTMTTIFRLLGLVAISSVGLAQSDATNHSTPDPDRETLLSLPWKEFDQTQNSGWRVYVNPTRKQYLVAARLIEEYLERHGELTLRQRVITHYHAAHQYIYRAVLTGEGKVSDAFPHLDKAIVPGKKTAPSLDWNDMVILTKAFLMSDRATLLEVKKRVAAMPPEAVRFLKSPNTPDEYLTNLGKPYGSWFPKEPPKN